MKKDRLNELKAEMLSKLEARRKLGKEIAETDLGFDRCILSDKQGRQIVLREYS